MVNHVDKTAYEHILTFYKMRTADSKVNVSTYII